MTWLKKVILGGSVCLGCVCLLALPAYAEIPEYNKDLITREASTSDQVGVAFLKMSNNFPDFSKVVEQSQEYQSINPLAREELIEKLVKKYQNYYLTFTPGKSDLVFRTRVNTLFRKMENGESALMINSLKGDPIYFPFEFANYPIALLIKDIESFKTLRLDATETDIVYKRLALSGDATLLLQLYPIAANDQKPVILDKISQYPLLTEIGYIGLLNRRGEQIWAWKNNKYGAKKSISKGGMDDRAIIDLVPEDRYINQPSKQ